MDDQAIRNFLTAEGRKLASEEPARITAAEWLILYDVIKDDLKEGVQANLNAVHAERIRKLYTK